MRSRIENHESKPNNQKMLGLSRTSYLRNRDRYQQMQNMHHDFKLINIHTHLRDSTECVFMKWQVGDWLQKNQPKVKEVNRSYDIAKTNCAIIMELSVCNFGLLFYVMQ